MTGNLLNKGDLMIKVAVNGAAGRMGRRLLALGSLDKEIELVAAIDYAAHPLQGHKIRDIEPEAACELVLRSDFDLACDTLIDFSTPQTTVLRAREAVEKGCALVIGTTGLDKDQEVALDIAAKKIPLIHAANYSLGVNLLVRIAGEVAKALGEEFNIEISETHHNQKADAPSGTAIAIARSICKATGRDMENDLVHGRSGRPGPRPAREIGMHALRMGSVVGDHSAFFGSNFEIIELAHRAQNRDVFASGALRAAKWLAGKKPGRYTMDDVLFA